MTEPREALHDDGKDLMAEIRAIRERISAQFGDDTYKLVALSGASAPPR